MATEIDGTPAWPRPAGRKIPALIIANRHETLSFRPSEHSEREPESSKHGARFGPPSSARRHAHRHAGVYWMPAFAGMTFAAAPYHRLFSRPPSMLSDTPVMIAGAGIEVLLQAGGHSVVARGSDEHDLLRCAKAYRRHATGGEHEKH